MVIAGHEDGVHFVTIVALFSALLSHLAHALPAVQVITSIVGLVAGLLSIVYHGKKLLGK